MAVWATVRSEHQTPFTVFNCLWLHPKHSRCFTTLFNAMGSYMIGMSSFNMHARAKDTTAFNISVSSVESGSEDTVGLLALDTYLDIDMPQLKRCMPRCSLSSCAVYHFNDRHPHNHIVMQCWYGCTSRIWFDVELTLAPKRHGKYHQIWARCQTQYLRIW